MGNTMLQEKEVLLQRYKISRLLGKGGMGSVYLAEDIRDGREWAIKAEKYNEDNYAFLSSEVEILSKLNHPALPRIHESVEADSYIYIVMEFVDGKTLEEILKARGKIAEQTVLKWFMQICDVLVYLHGRDVPIVYRDLKPSNIMVQPSGDIKIIDFGIAREYQPSQKQDEKVTALTRGYAAPEQYDSRYLADVRTDIYALGVTVHYMLTGKNPNDPPFYFRAVRKLNPNISYAMEYIVKKCIQPNPDKRYADATELQKELQQIQNLEQNLKKKRSRTKAKIVITSMGVVLIAILVFAGVRTKRSSTIHTYYQYLEQAQNDVNAGQWEAAADKYREAIEMQPEAWEAYLGLADLYLKQEKYEECHDCLTAAADKFPDLFEDERFLEIMEQLYAD